MYLFKLASPHLGSYMKEMVLTNEVWANLDLKKASQLPLYLFVAVYLLNCVQFFCDPMDYSHGAIQASLFMEFPRQEY